MKYRLLSGTFAFRLLLLVLSMVCLATAQDVYGGLGEDAPVPADAPPMFIAAATDDNVVPAPASIALYQKWTAANKPAELHIYAKGGHGFGGRVQNLPTDHWIDRFADWLQLEGFLRK